MVRFSLTLQITALVAVATLVSVGSFALASVVQGTRDVAEAQEERQEATTELAAVAIQEALTRSRDTLQVVGASVPDEHIYPPDEEALAARFQPLVPGTFSQVHLRDERGTFFSIPPARKPPTSGEDVVVDPVGVSWHVALSGRDPELRVVGVVPQGNLLDILYRYREEGREMALLQEGFFLDTRGSLDAASLEATVANPVVTERAVGDTGLRVRAVEASGAPAIQTRIVGAALATGLVVLAGGIIVGAVMARGVTAPVKEVAEVARGIKKGDLALRVAPRGPPEVHGLGSDVNAMAEQLARDHASLMRSNEELASEVAARTTQLERRQAETEQFFYGVAHDIKGPAVGIRSVLQLIDERIENRDGRTALLLEQGQRSADQLQRLVNDLLQFAAAEKVRPAPRPVDVREFVRTCLIDVVPLGKERGVQVVNEAPRVQVEVDPDILQRVVQNLARNAVLHMPDRGGVVQVEASVDGDDMCLSIQDNGSGMAPEAVERMFTPFTRGGTNAPGSGVGLSIVRRLVEAHGGTITCHSVPGRGTRFQVHLPGVARRARLRRNLPT